MNYLKPMRNLAKEFKITKSNLDRPLHSCLEARATNLRTGRKGYRMTSTEGYISTISTSSRFGVTEKPWNHILCLRLGQTMEAEIGGLKQRFLNFSRKYIYNQYHLPKYVRKLSF